MERKVVEVPVGSPTLLVADLQRHTAYFDQLTTPLPGAGKSSFSH